MGDFSIEGIAAIQKEKQRQEEQSRAKDTDKKDRLKEIRQIQSTTMKQAMKEKEKYQKAEEDRDRRLLLYRVERRFKAFAFLQDKIPPPSKNPSIAELQEIEETQKLELDVQGSEARIKQYMQQGAMLIERIWGDGRSLTMLPEHLRLNLTGLTAMFTSPLMQKEIQPLIMETVIEYPHIGQMSLPLRWASTLVNVMFTIHAMNTDPALKALMSGGKITIPRMPNVPAPNWKNGAASPAPAPAPQQAFSDKPVTSEETEADYFSATV